MAAAVPRRTQSPRRPPTLLDLDELLTSGLILSEDWKALPLDERLSYAAGAAISCGTGTAWGAFERMGLTGRDTLAVFGHFLELWESTETMRGLLGMIEEAARDWDGRDPIRPLGP